MYLVRHSLGFLGDVTRSEKWQACRSSSARRLSAMELAVKNPVAREIVAACSRLRIETLFEAPDVKEASPEPAGDEPSQKADSGLDEDIARSEQPNSEKNPKKRMWDEAFGAGENAESGFPELGLNG
ncbi:signal recognition particle subunit [Ciborinia camelliae]|nr:signal recognition particle subunit [Ciborinia camelliae]